MSLNAPQHRTPTSPLAGWSPLPCAGIGSVFDVAYRELAQHRPIEEILVSRCRAVAEALGLPLVALMARHDAGSLEIRATSDETLLWAELVRLPERWDGTVTGDGPATRTLRGNVAVVMALGDEGAAPWRKAAERDGLSHLGAWPVAAWPIHVLYVGARDLRLAEEPALRQRIAEAAAEFAALFAASAAGQEKFLLASQPSPQMM